jgi:CheY-like chemotaxis protein
MGKNSAAPPRGGNAEGAADPEQKTDAERDVILVVDDDAAVRATVIMQLERLGYAVREADSGLAALQIIESTARIGLLLTDVTMPGMNGKELAVHARRRRPDMPILFTSGFPGGAQGNPIVLDADDVLLAKPYRQRDLARMVRKMLSRRP